MPSSLKKFRFLFIGLLVGSTFAFSLPPEDHLPQDPSLSKTLPSASFPFLYFFSGKNRDLADSRTAEIETLRNCGFDVRAYDLARVDFNKLDLRSFSKDTPVFLGATHGSKQEADDQGSKSLIIDSSGISLRGNRFFDEVRMQLAESPIWVGTCHAGLARNSGCMGLGTSCSKCEGNKATTNKHSEYFVDQSVISLYCDSISKCEQWDLFDKEPKDGILSGREINASMAKRFRDKGVGGSRRRTNGVKAYQDWASTKQDRKACESQKNTFLCEENLDAFTVKIEKKTEEGKWAKTDYIRLPRAQRAEDIPTLRRGMTDMHQYTPEFETILAKKWPKTKNKKAEYLIEHLIDLDGTFSVSEAGDILEVKNQTTVEFYQIKNISPKKDAFPIECSCVFPDSVPYYQMPDNDDSQQVYFDPEFKIRCQK